MAQNILYIMTDQQRYDSLSLVGRTQCRTPNLDALASEGALFDNAYSVCALCSPARSSMLTGLYPHTHMMWNNNDMMQWATRDLPDNVPLISQNLVDAGYRCGYVGKWHCGESKLPGDYGFEGMNVPNYGNPYKTEEHAEYLKNNGLTAPEIIPSQFQGFPGYYSGPPEACSPYFLTEYAVTMLESMCEQNRKDDTPFFLFLSFWGPHGPYLVPEPYASMYKPNDIELWPSFRENLSGKPAVQDRFRRRLSHHPWASDEAWRDRIAKYFGFCSFIDNEIGRLLAVLEDRGLAQETAVLFSTDHGDMTGSHGGFMDKGPFMYEETYHIPLIMRIPGLVPRENRIGQFVSNMDLGSTALDIAGLPVPEEHQGRSLLPLINAPDSPWRDDIMCEFHGHRFLYSQRMLRFGDYKYIFNPPDIDELYDLVKDPHELVNVINEPNYSETLQEGRQRLQQWMKDTDDPLLMGTRALLQ